MKIVFIVSRIPYPLEKGDKLRAYNHLKLLSEKHEVTLIALNEGEIHPDADAVLSRITKRFVVFEIPKLIRILSLFLAVFRKRPFSTAYFYNKLIQINMREVIEEVNPAHIFCQLTRVSEYVRDIKDKPKTLDYQDAFAKGMERRAAKEPFYLRWLFRLENKRLKNYETEVFSDFENKIIISKQDRENIDHPDKEKIVVVPNGVDLDFYKPVVCEKKYDLLFTGNMAYPPNIESVVFLVNEILPLVKKQKPDVKLLIAGTDPVKRILALQSKNVEVSGWVDDIRESYAATKLFIAPMQISIGLQNKLLEAMAMKIPCITSELANNALGGTPGKNIIVCVRPNEYAEAILKLLENSEEAERIASAGNEFVKENYSWQKMTEPLLRLIES